MMTREEATEILENKENYVGIQHIPGADVYISRGLVEAINVALSALRPVSREQVEKVFHGCEMCREEKKVKSDNFCGAATMRIVGDSIDLRGDEKKIKFFGHIYAPSFSVRFCPFCGKPLTDEAVDMMLERLEEVENES